MANLKRIIERHCEQTGEKVIGFVLGEPFPQTTFGEENLNLLDRELVVEYGGIADENDALYLWTDKSVLVLTEYDGKPMMKVIPRDPTAVTPTLFSTYDGEDLANELQCQFCGATNHNANSHPDDA